MFSIKLNVRWGSAELKKKKKYTIKHFRIKLQGQSVVSDI